MAVSIKASSSKRSVEFFHHPSSETDLNIHELGGIIIYPPIFTAEHPFEMLNTDNEPLANFN